MASNVRQSEEEVEEVGLPGVPIRGRSNSVRSKRAKSQLTRTKLCRATARLLDQKPLRAIKVSDITHIASVSPSTFYIYFADVDEAVLAVIDDIQSNMPDLVTIIEGFSLPGLEAGVRAFVKDYIAFWDEHFAILRIRNLAADEGQPRFREARAKMLGPTLFALEARLVAFRGEELTRAKVLPGAVAALIMGQMERLASLVRIRPATRDLTRRKLIDASVFMICELMRGAPVAKDAD